MEKGWNRCRMLEEGLQCIEEWVKWGQGPGVLQNMDEQRVQTDVLNFHGTCTILMFMGQQQNQFSSGLFEVNIRMKEKGKMEKLMKVLYFWG